ncbi:macrophage mannose receptor 1-like isoform X7 [Perca flavescens]|uniref:macrophage mannose receptor 1-like isoform X7 n=1 Tax=Perca flavescens TaxID=8167 RepID=UPI00106E69F1|nr:macrophage mannose receptor 1-like isoform X7 [Perca flavescens]
MQWSLFVLILMAVYTCTSGRDIRETRGEKKPPDFHLNRARMQWSLILFILMGQCSFFVCELYEYHFINESKTWSEAQSYCREHYTDLATVSNATDMNKLNGSQNQDGAWIGLRCIYTKSLNTWWCSLPGEEGNNPEKCVLMRDGEWFDFPCTHQCKCICYDGTRKSGKSFSFINNKMTLPEAQNYCREHHTDLVCGVRQLQNEDLRTEADKLILIKEAKTWQDALDYCRKNNSDLVSITNLDQQRQVQEIAKNAVSSHIWLGLRYTCTMDLWFWVTDKLVCYENWASEITTDACDMAAAMGSGGQHKWSKKTDNEKFNFICSK